MISPMPPMIMVLAMGILQPRVPMPMRSSRMRNGPSMGLLGASKVLLQLVNHVLELGVGVEALNAQVHARVMLPLDLDPHVGLSSKISVTEIYCCIRALDVKSTSPGIPLHTIILIASSISGPQ